MKPYLDGGDVALYVGDARETLAQLEPDSVDCIVTSPPYYLLRDYGPEGQIGLEETLEEYVTALVDVFAECRRVLKPRGVFWLNLGDTHCSAQRGPRHGRTSRLTTPERQERVSPVVNKRGRAPNVKPKDLFLAPFEVARALREDGWWLRQVVIWDKKNTVPESAKDRPTTSHEYVFQLAKSRIYDYDYDAIAEPAVWERWGRQTNRKHPTNGTTDHGVTGRPRANFIAESSIEELNVRWPGVGGRSTRARKAATQGGHDESEPMAPKLMRNARSVWRLNAAQFPDAHDAVMPNELAEKCILAGCPKGGTVLDPFAGAGTTLVIAKRLGRRAVGIELSEENGDLVRRRLAEWWKDPWRPPALPDDQLSLEASA